MTLRTLLHWLVALAALAVIATASVWAQGTSACANCGIVQTIRPVSDRQQWTPLGTVSDSAAFGGGPGGQPGASAMLSIGPGGTNRGMVMVGAAGGAAYAQKPNDYKRQRWEVVVKMDDGPPRTLSLAYEPFVQEGDRVRVSGNQLELVNP
jgi:hypothetical protein